MKTKLIKLQFTSSGSIVTKTAILEIPDKLSDLIDDSNFVTDSELSAAIIELNSRIDGMDNVFSFDTYNNFVSWLSGSYTRSDGRTTSDLRVGSVILLEEENKPDYWCNSTASSYTIANFTAYESKQNFVRFDDTQTLSDANKSTARNNIGAASANDLSNEISARETADTSLANQINGLVKVSANPTGDATVSLLKLQVGSIIYSIPVYTLPVASSSVLGGIKSQTAGTEGTNYPVEVDSNGNAKVNVKTNTFTVTENTDGTVDLTIE